jgi:hypothetical protein
MTADLRELQRLEPAFFRAPSAHNTQPWLLEYAPDRIELRFDPERELPAGDPTRRDLLLSLGALVEAVLIVAAEAGPWVAFEPAVDLAATRIGAFVAAGSRYSTPFTSDDLERRQTSRFTYEPAPLGEDDLAAARAALGSGAALHVLEARGLVDLYVRSDRRLYDSPPVVEELRSWLRLSPRHPRYRQDGLSYECLALPRAGAAVLGLLLRPRVYPLVRSARIPRLFTAATRSVLDCAGTVLVLTGDAGEPEQVLAHGRALLRVWLALARRGLYAHPLSQILDDERTKMELAARVGAEPFAVFRAGRSKAPARSARLR